MGYILIVVFYGDSVAGDAMNLLEGVYDLFGFKCAF